MKELTVVKAPDLKKIAATEAIFGAAFAAPKELIPKAAVTERDDLLERAGALETVTSEGSQSAVAEILKLVAKMLSDTEKDRKSAKKPFADIGKRIDEEVREYVETLAIEKTRLQGLLGAYQHKIEAAAAEERRKQQAEMARLEAEKRAKAKAAQDAIDAEQDEQKRVNMAAEATLEQSNLTHKQANIQPAEATKAAGTTVRTTWEFTVEDSAALYAARPELVDLVPRRGLIRMALEEGSLPGVTAKKVTNVTASGR
jgi:hypothetical protein